MRKEYPNTYKTKMVEKYKKSKMKISEFCRTNEIPTSTFNRWILEDKMDLEKSSNFGEISTNLLENNNITDVRKETIKVEKYFKTTTKLVIIRFKNRTKK